MRATTVLPPPWLNTADAEIKVPFAGNSELSNVILVCIWSGSESVSYTHLTLPTTAEV